MEAWTTLAPGLVLDRYELICPIARGGMASVWIARQTGKHGFERIVAIKTILPEFAADASFQTMFLDEARITSRIEHNNVARVLDVGEQQGVTYLVIEYVDGDALSTINRVLKASGAKWSPAIILRIMADVCRGLHAAHELRGQEGQLLGVVHRDVSPHNILVGPSGDAKLIDFGIAKARDRLSGNTSTGTIKGKVRYMAPELAWGTAYDRRADLWAIGAILYEALSGKAPYERDNDVQILSALTSGVPPPPLTTVHEAVASVVRRALEAQPEKRFETAAAMQQAIESAMVAAKWVADTAAVATFLEPHLVTRAAARKEAMQRGLKAAAQRESLRPPRRTGDPTHPARTDHEAPNPARDPGDPISSTPGEPALPNGSLGSAAVGLPLRSPGGRRLSLRSTALAVSLVGAAAATALRLSATPSVAASGASSATPSVAASGAWSARSAYRASPSVVAAEALPVSQNPAVQDAQAAAGSDSERLAFVTSAAIGSSQGSSAARGSDAGPPPGSLLPRTFPTAALRQAPSARPAASSGAVSSGLTPARKPRIDDGF
jgi:eukaryotic-like serine/threonine-protein kinase